MRLLKLHAPHARPKSFLINLPGHLHPLLRNPEGLQREERRGPGHGRLGGDAVGKEGGGGEDAVEEAGALKDQEGVEADEGGYKCGVELFCIARIRARGGAMELGVVEVATRCYRGGIVS